MAPASQGPFAFWQTAPRWQHCVIFGPKTGPEKILINPLMKRTLLLAAFGLLMVLPSCKKNNPAQNGNTVLAGNWTFLTLTAHTQASSQYTDAGILLKDVFSSDYASTNNTGSLLFFKDSMNSSNIAYTVSTEVFDSSFENQSAVYTFSSPFAFVFQPVNLGSPFNLAGSDSIAFPGGCFIGAQNLPNGFGQIVPTGFRYKISGSLLTLTSNITKDTVEMISGNTTALHENASFAIELIKQQ